MAQAHFSSYRDLFRIRWKIYSLGDRPLPRPLPLDALAVYVMLLPLAWLLAPVPAALFRTGRWPAALVLGAALAWAALRIDPQGRSAAVYLLDLAAFLARPRRRAFGGGPVRGRRRARARWEALDLDV